MFISVGNLLSPLYPLIALFSAIFGDKEDDKPDNSDQSSEKGKAGEQDDGGDDDDEEDDEEDDDEISDDSDEEEEDDEDDDDLDDELDDHERTGRKADTAISNKDAKEVVPALQAIVRTMVKYPDSAEETLNDLRESSPQLASRLAKMYEGGKNEALNEALKDAPDGLRELLSKLVEDTASLKQRTEEDDKEAQDAQIRDERRMYKGWERESHPYLNPKSDESKTPLGKNLVKEFRAAVNRLPANEPVTEDLLEDALAIAVRRSGWDTGRVSAQQKQQAKEQAQKARSGVIGSGKGKKGKKGDANPSKSRITAEWPNQSDDRQTRVDEVKAKRFPNLSQ